jgi:hypothetical protein
MIRRRAEPQAGRAARWAMLVALLLALSWLLLQPRLERLDGQVLVRINGVPIDLIGVLEEGWGRMVSDCARVRDRTAEPALNREVLEALRGYSPPDSLSARVVGIYSASEWLLVEATFDALPPVLVLMRARPEPSPLSIEALWSGSTYPWRTVPFAGRFLQVRVPEVPSELVRCVEPRF